jgi:glycosyltransferase involved in cell wall biosynthesis
MIGDCNTIRDLAISYGMQPERIVTFPWGVDLGHFRPRDNPSVDAVTSKKQATSRPFTLLSTRGWEPIYGVDVIARAFVQAARQIQSLRLVMLGNGSQTGLLRRVFISGGVEDRVVYPGQVGYDELPTFYQAADIYISASHSDGTSISMLEALACGTPCLVSDIPGNREWITPGGNGWLFADNDAVGLAQGIVQAYETAQDLSRWKALSEVARGTAEKRADWRKNFQLLLAAFDMAMEIGSGKTRDQKWMPGNRKHGGNGL